MKHNKLLYLALILLCSGCVDAQKWTDDYDINFPAPSIETIDRTKVETGDTLHLMGSFEKLTTATIGDGYMKIISLSDDNKTVALLVAESCVSGKLVLQNAYQQKYTYSTNITVVNKGTVEIPEEIPVLDFSDTNFSPLWIRSTWTEARTFGSQGYDLNPITPPTGYDHFYCMNDTLLFPPNEPVGQGGNIPYGNYTYDNEGSGFNIALYADPYVSVLINTGNDIAYLSLVIDDEIRDFEPSHSPEGVFANGEKRHYMKTDNKWLWYSFSLKNMLGKDLPDKIKSAGLFIRNSWDYGADIYPGFQLNIVKMVITDGPILQETPDDEGDPGEPVKVIFDTDMCFDVDDVGALAVLHTYADRKAAEILAVCFNETHKDGAAAIDAINTWYGRGDIPIGIFKGMLENPDKSNYLSYLAAYPHDVPQDNNSIKSAVDVYVETLSAQPDHSVVIISVGFLNNLELLLAAHKDLVARKVKKMVIMGGLIKDDFNFVRHNLVSITENVLKEWPTPIVITQLGGDVYTGACLEAQPDSPVREAYYRWFGNKFEGRSSWDAFAVLYAIKGKDFFVEKWDSDIVLQNGVSINMEEGRLHYITPLFTPGEYRRVIDDLICKKDR